MTPRINCVQLGKKKLFFYQEETGCFWSEDGHKLKGMWKVRWSYVWYAYYVQSTLLGGPSEQETTKNMIFPALKSLSFKPYAPNQMSKEI